jgi:AcrR family transcriptional regulator
VQTANRKRVTKRPEDRRADLLAAGERLLAAKGVASTTVADITVEAGVAKGTFYLYFSSKEDLLQALLEGFVQGFVEHTAALYEQIGHTDDWWWLADQAVERLIDYDLDHRDLHLILHEASSPETTALMQRCQRELQGLLVVGIKGGIEAGAFSARDPELMAELLYWAAEGAVHNALSQHAGVDRDRLVAAVQELARKALAPSVSRGGSSDCP